MRKFKPSILFIFIIGWFLFACNFNNNKNTETTADSNLLDGVGDTTTFISNANKNKKHNYKKIIDTVWVKPSGKLLFQDTLRVGENWVIATTTVDTLDLIIDTLYISTGARMIIGYNHQYELSFYNKDWENYLIVSINKKQHLSSLLEGTDYWLESNLNVFKRILMNEKYKSYIVEFDINPKQSFETLFYFVLDLSGNITYQGTASGWGGADQNGSPFITGDSTFYISAFELYSFSASKAVGISEFVHLAVSKNLNDTTSEYQWVQAIRSINDNHFLTIFSRNGNLPVFNALILATDTSVTEKFRYYKMMEEMDANVQLIEVPTKNNCYLFDSERESLLIISTTQPIQIKEKLISDIPLASEEVVKSNDFISIEFEDFGNYRFLISKKDTLIFSE